MKNNTPKLTRETRWTSGAWLILLAAILFILLNVAHIGYRFTIPSLGWAGLNPDDETQAEDFILIEQAVSGPSLLKPGDAVQSIAGIPAREVLETVFPSVPKPANWEIGELVRLAVEREGRFLEFDVQLVHWIPSAWLYTNLGSFGEVWIWLITLLLFGIGTYTFLNRPGNLAARFLFAFGLANLSITLGDSIPDYLALYFDGPAAIAKVFFSNIIFAYLLAPSFLGFSLSFPHPKTFIKRQPLLLLVPYLVGVCHHRSIDHLSRIGCHWLSADILDAPAWYFRIAPFRLDDAGRDQPRTVKMGNWGRNDRCGNLFVEFRKQCAVTLPGDHLGVANLGSPIIAISLAMAILRYRLFDIDVIIRKTLQYTSADRACWRWSISAAFYCCRAWLKHLTGEQSPIVIVISTLVIAALFNPLRIRIQDFIDRRFFRKKYDAEQTLARFAEVARDEVEMDNLTAALLGVVEQTMQPQKVSLWLREREMARRE